MIGIATVVYDIEGDLTFVENEDTKLDDSTARVTITATLDGGGVISHYGFSDSDRVFEIKAYFEEASADKLKWIFENHQFIYVATRLGLFKAAISRLWENLGAINITVLVQEKHA